MNKNEKEILVSQIKELISKSAAVYVVDYSKVTVAQISNIRRTFRQDGLTYKVFKNSLVKKAVEELGGYDKLGSVLQGMNGFIFAEDNIVGPAKLIKKFNGEIKKFNFKGCYIETEFYGADQLENLANMPSKEEIMAGIVGSIAAPASGIVGAINAVMRDVVSLIDEISKKKAA